MAKRLCYSDKRVRVGLSGRGHIERGACRRCGELRGHRLAVLDCGGRGFGMGVFAEGARMTHYYQLLEVSENASVEVLRAAWKILSRVYHPDNQETGNAEKFRSLHEAYSVLSDPVKKQAYDVELGAARQGARPNRTTPGVDFTGWNPAAYPDPYQDLAETIPEVMNEFGRNVAVDVGQSFLNQVLQNMHPSLRAHFANAMKKAGNRR